MKRKKILMVAYACNPEGGGEHWLGWGWVLAAKHIHDVWLITPANNVETISQHAEKEGVSVSFVSLPAWQKKFCAVLGGAGSWLRKYLWQFQARQEAQRLHREEIFDLVHQTTFHTFRIPFSCASLGIPSVWGPIAGGESVPAGFARYLGKDALSEKMRAWFNQLCLWIPGVKSSLRRSAVILCSNRTTKEFLPTWVQDKCELVPANAVSPKDLSVTPLDRTKLGECYQLIYVGNCVSRRALPIVFEALKNFLPEEVHLRVVGNGSALTYWKQEAARLGVEKHVEFTGNVDSATVRKYYDEADALAFPSLRDSGGSSLIEAMTRGIPVLCLDWGGPAEMIDSESGIKLPVRNAEETVAMLVESIKRLKSEPEWGKALAAKARNRALTLYTWEGKRSVLETIYNHIWQ